MALKNNWRAHGIALGGKIVAQSLPNPQIDHVDPFLLLHHAGPWQIESGIKDFDVPPHPHRGFEPITFIFQGGVKHRDSLGNQLDVEAPGVQWISAARGLIHAEGLSDQLLQEGGTFEIIQLWVNLPANQKMTPPTYIAKDQNSFKQLSLESGNGKVYLVSGRLQDKNGNFQSKSQVDSAMAFLLSGDVFSSPLKKGNAHLLYILGGSVIIEGEKYEKEQLVQLNSETNLLNIKAVKDTRFLLVSAPPLNEPIATFGPYVMNTQTEIMQALRDYNQGKMGFLPLS